MSNYYVMIHDEKRCIGCQACYVACANLNQVSEGFARVQVQINGPNEKSRYEFKRVSCQHCEKSPCVAVCPTGASYVDEHGTVRIDTSKCIACGFCMSACPYHVRYIKPSEKVMDKCDFCSLSRLANGEAPACVTVCPTDALIFNRINSDEVKEWLKNHPEAYFDVDKKAGEAHLIRRLEIHERD